MTLFPMTPVERRAVGGLALIMSTRLLGLFLILPVFALYAEGLAGQTPFLIGLALGAYGLTQALLQIPYGMLSDRYGRKPVILVGLVVFAIGSVVAAEAQSIAGVILGRALQGAGAISAVVVALLADLTRETQRTKAMAAIGITIGASFILALMLGPVLGAWIRVPGIFWLTAGMAVFGMIILSWIVPTPSVVHAPPLGLAAFHNVIRDARLLRLNIGIFLLHAVLMALFVAVPVALVREGGLPMAAHWRVYLPTMAASVIFLLPMIYFAERRGQLRRVFLLSIVLLGASQLALSAEAKTLAGLTGGILLFFIGFNFLEATLPSLVSRLVDTRTKGTAIGVYSSFEFLGAFAGGAAGGFVAGHFGFAGVFLANGVLVLIWLVVAASMPPLPQTRTCLLRLAQRVPTDARALAQELSAIAGVADATIVPEEGVAYLKIDERTLDRQALARYGEYS